MGIIFVNLPIFSLIFGSDEPAMQTDNAAIVMTGMIFIGIVMLAKNSPKHKTNAVTPVQMQRRIIRPASIEHAVIPQSSSVMTHGSISGREVITRVLVVCPYCGSKNDQGIFKCQNCSADL